MMKKYLYIAAAGLLSITGLASCSLDEYNPTAGSADTSTIDDVNVWKGLQAHCYSSLYHELYSKIDFLLVSECGTDLWLNPANQSYAPEVFYYNGLGVSRSEPSKTWQQAYSIIPTCNTVINRAADVKNGNPNDINILVAEAKCIRAFMYLTLATYFGPIPLVTSEVTEFDLSPQRNSLAEVYAYIVTDLKEAAAVLNVEPYDGNYARVCKKTALGLLARAYAQGAAEGLSEGDKSYWECAKEVSEDMINNATAYGMYLYPDVSDLWAVDNNRDNKEALFTAAGLDAKGPNAGMAAYYFNAANYLYAYTKPDPSSLTGLYGKINSTEVNDYLGTRKQGGIMAPTKHAIEVFDEKWDKRYENTFLTAFGLFTFEDISTYGFSDMTITLLNNRRYGDICAIYNIDRKFQDREIHPYVALAQIERPGGTQVYAKGIYKKGSTSGGASNIESTKNPMVVEMPLAEDEDRIPIYLSKEYLDATEKAKRGYFCMNIDDLFDADGNYKTEPYVANPNYTGTDGKEKTTANQLFPGLVKYNWLFDGVIRNANGECRNGDIYIMRAAEIYLIAAEANVMTGHAGDAAKYLKPLRDRACRKGQTAPELTNPTEQDILDEYAREFCGEHMRWAVLKRHRTNGLMRDALKNYNKKAARGFNENIHYCRPIPQTFLDQIDNAQEFGDNGYGYVGNKGY